MPNDHGVLQLNDYVTDVESARMQIIFIIKFTLINIYTIIVLWIGIGSSVIMILKFE